MSTESISDAIVAVAQTISAPKGRPVRGAVQVAALLLYGLLPESHSLEEAETDAFWCFFQPPGCEVRPKTNKHVVYILY